MAKVIDWERAKRALVALDELARNNPHRCYEPSGGKWQDNLEELDELTQDVLDEQATIR